jgi:fermentation-respiration switch protein FrsA (DUF1100 family)
MIANVSILLVTCLCIAYIGINLYALSQADRHIFPAPVSSYQNDANIVPLPTSAGDEIATSYRHVASADKLLLYSHGNGTDIGRVSPFINAMEQHGVAVLTYDYPGYGTSTGSPSESGCYAAIEAVFQYATQTLGYSPDQIILYGRSLGGGPTTWLAQRKPIAGLILDGAFSSAFRVKTQRKLLLWDKFDNLARLPTLKCPAMIIHGTDDRVVPFSHAERNFQALPGPKYRLFVDGAGHNGLIRTAGPKYWEHVIPFIKGKLQ